MTTFKINQPVKANDGNIGRVLFYTDYKAHGDKSEPSSAVILFVNNWSNKYPFTALKAISHDEYDQAVKADKKAVRDILTNPVAQSSGI